MTCHRTYRHRMTFAQFYTLIKVGHMPVLPVRLEAILSGSVGLPTISALRTDAAGFVGSSARARWRWQPD